MVVSSHRRYVQACFAAPAIVLLFFILWFYDSSLKSSGIQASIESTKAAPPALKGTKLEVTVQNLDSKVTKLEERPLLQVPESASELQVEEKDAVDSDEEKGDVEGDLEDSEPPKASARSQGGDQDEEPKEEREHVTQEKMTSNENKHNDQSKEDMSGGQVKAPLVNSQKQEDCIVAQAYHNGAMVDDNAIAKDARRCLAECNAKPLCKFWDFGASYCRLRGDSGPSGAVTAVGYVGGPKNCALPAKGSSATHGRFVSCPA